MNPVVVDASLAVKEVIDETDSPQANELLDGWRQRGVERVAPQWCRLEVANALRQRVLAGSVG